MSDEQNRENENANRPVDKLWDGGLKASIWRNEGERGAFFSTTFARTYKDQDGELRDAHTFDSADLLKLSELARQAHHRVNDLAREAFRQRREAENGTKTRTRTRDRAH